MIEDFVRIIMIMEQAHLRWPSLRFCQIIELVSDAVKDNFNLSDAALLIMLEKYMEKN